jgi:hypothetical protein
MAAMTIPDSSRGSVLFGAAAINHEDSIPLSAHKRRGDVDPDRRANPTRDSSMKRSDSSTR